MSMTRFAAIEHFCYAKYRGMTIAQAVAQAPEAVQSALHIQDHMWIAKHHTMDAYEAVERLYARSSSNPEGEPR
jgi:hypothetical protein